MAITNMYINSCSVDDVLLEELDLSRKDLQIGKDDDFCIPQFSSLYCQSPGNSNECDLAISNRSGMCTKLLQYAKYTNG